MVSGSDIAGKLSIEIWWFANIMKTLYPRRRLFGLQKDFIINSNHSHVILNWVWSASYIILTDCAPLQHNIFQTAVMYLYTHLSKIFQFVVHIYVQPFICRLTIWYALWKKANWFITQAFIFWCKNNFYYYCRYQYESFTAVTDLATLGIRTGRHSIVTGSALRTWKSLILSLLRYIKNN